MRRCNGVSKRIYKSEMSRMDVKMMTSGMVTIEFDRTEINCSFA